MITAALVARSAGYAAPESEAGHISTKSDMFSYGVVCTITVLSVVHGTLPFTVCFRAVYWKTSILKEKR